MTKHSQEDRCDVLVLGVQGCGKSLLVRRVLNIAQKSSGSSSEKLDFDVVATIGVELQRMVHKRGKILIREVGGGMLPIWAQHMRDWRMLIYVIDASDPSMLAAACMEFFVLLTQSDLEGRPLLVVLNKIDCPYVMARTEMDMSMQLQNLPDDIQKCLTVIETSAVEGTGTNGVLEWILSNI